MKRLAQVLLAVFILFSVAFRFGRGFSGFACTESNMDLGKGGWIDVSEGLFGGNVYKLVIDYANPQNLYLYTFEKGVFKSNDGGEEWRAAGNGISGVIEDIAIDPINSSILYVATRGFIYKTEDGGENWNRINITSLPVSYYGYKLLIDSKNTSVLYLAISHVGIFRSDDYGKNWKQLENGLTTNLIYTVALDTRDTSTVYVGTGGEGVYKSIDNGEHWTLIGSRDNGLFNPFVTSFIVDPKDSKVLYAGTGCGLIRSVDGGKQWSSVNSIPCGGVDEIVFDYTNPNNIYVAVNTHPNKYGGLFKSSDNGKTWTRLTNDENKLFAVTAIALDTGNQNNIYVGTKDKGVLKSSDGGLTWGKINNGLRSLLVYDAVFGNNIDNIYILTNNGVFATEDSGLTWLEMNEGLSGTEFHSIAISSVNKSTLFVGTNEGVFKSTDGGRSWIRQIDDTSYDHLIQVSRSSSIVYVVTYDGMFYTSLNEGGFWLSKELKLKGYPSSMAVDLNNPAIVYLATFDGEGKAKLYRTSNNGLNWVEIDYGEEFSPRYIYDILGAKNGNIVYLATLSGIIKTEDGGQKWSKVGTSHTALDLELDPYNPNIVYSAQSSGLYRSLDGGLNWESFVISGICDFIKLYNYENFTYLLLCTGINYNGGTNLLKYLPVPDAPLLVSPKNNGYSYTLTPTLSWEKVEGVDSYRLLIADNILLENPIIDVTLQDLSFTVPTGTLSDNKGYFWCVFSKKGIAQSNRSELRNFIVIEDFSAPILTITSPADNQTFDSPNITVKGVSTDAQSGIDKVTVNGAEVSVLSGGSFSKTITLTEGVNGIAIVAKDKAGNETKKTLTVTYKKPVKTTVIILQIGNKNFTVNGETRTLDSPPIIKNGRTLLPIRAVVEALGGTVGWDALQKKVTITLGATTIELWIGKSIAKVNGIDTPIDATNPKVVPEIINSRTMLPLRFVTESLGCTVDWDGTTKTITIRYQA